MIAALILLCLGALMIAPALNYAATGVKSTTIHERRAKEVYAADAGVEYAVWKMKDDQVSPYPRSYALADINGYSANITIANVDHEIYKVTSVAGGTTIEAHTAPPDCIYFPGEQNFDQDTILNGNVYVDGNCTIGRNSEVRGDLYVVGDLHLNQCNNITGSIYATGTIQIDRLPGWIITIGGSVHSGVDLTVDRDVWVSSNVSAVGDINLSQNVHVFGNAYAGGTVNYNPTKTTIDGTVENSYVGDWPPPPDFVDDRHKLIGYKII